MESHLSSQPEGRLARPTGRRGQLSPRKAGCRRCLTEGRKGETGVLPSQQLLPQNGTPSALGTRVHRKACRLSSEESRCLSLVMPDHVPFRPSWDGFRVPWLPRVTIRPFLSPQQVYEILKRTTCTKAKYSMGEELGPELSAPPSPNLASHHQRGRRATGLGVFRRF